MRKTSGRFAAVLATTLLNFWHAAAYSQVAPAPSAVKEEMVELSPFVVQEPASDTYEATNTNSVTGTNIALGKTPLDARIFNRTLMDELGVVDIAAMLSDFGGTGMPILGSGNHDQRGYQDGDGVDYKSISIRGLVSSNPRRDGFLRSDTSLMDSFDVESAEALQGSNSLLFGSGDAGGVVNINSKRARLNKNSLRFTAKIDSEGSRRFTGDINAGTRTFAVRLNAVNDEQRYYRPALGIDQKGIQLAATVRPWKSLTISGELRDYTRSHSRAGAATLRTPTNLLLETGERLDGQITRYAVGVGGSALTNGFLDYSTESSMLGVYTHHHYLTEAKAIAVEFTPRRDLAFQFRYGHDARVNESFTASANGLFHPDDPRNLLKDANGNPARQWALNAFPVPLPYYQGARGYKFTGTFQADRGRWGNHRLTAFVSDQESWTRQESWRYYEVNASGELIQNLANLSDVHSGRLQIPAPWLPAMPETIFGTNGATRLPDMLYQDGKAYRLAQRIYAGAVTPTAGNPLGLSGPINAATGRSTVTDLHYDDVRERSIGVSTFSSLWRDRIDVMAGFRFESAETRSLDTGVLIGPIDYDSTTLGLVFDTPLKGVRIYGNYATNAKIDFDTNTDVFNQPLPVGQGVSRDIGLKFSLWEHRLSGNVGYYVTEQKNFTGTLGGFRNDIDPVGINGRHGGEGYVYSKTSDGLSAALSMRPRTWWEATLSFVQSDGSERSDVSLAPFYNDQFNTTTANGALAVAVRNAGSGTLSPLMVRSDPANATSPLVPLSIAMLRDRTSPYFATLDPDSGQITNAQSLGLTTAGVGTNLTGLTISEHQLGFVPPAPTITVRKAGEQTFGYAETAFSLINRFQIRQGRLKGLVFGHTLSLRLGVRGYMYTLAAAGGARKMFYYPDKLDQGVFAMYRFKAFKRFGATIQANVSNLFDDQARVTLPNPTTGTPRYFSEWYTPRKFAITAAFGF
ncbi:MAG: TonB-dependent receptor plug domain-containing protein [Verrucomicrobiota bacterium]